MDPEIQEQIDGVFASYGSADSEIIRHNIELLNSIREVPNYPIYVINSISNPNLDLNTRTTASNVLLNLIPKLHIDQRKSFKEGAANLIHILLETDYLPLINSIADIIGEMINDLGSAELLTQLVDVVTRLICEGSGFTEEGDELYPTVMTGLSILHRILYMGRDFPCEGFIAVIPDIIMKQCEDVTSIAMAIVSQYCSFRPEMMKDTVLVPIMPAFYEMYDFTKAALLVALDSLVAQNGLNEFELSQEEAELISNVIKEGLACENSDVHLKAIYFIQEGHLLSFDQEIFQILYQIAGIEEDTDPNKSSAQALDAISALSENFPEEVHSAFSEGCMDSAILEIGADSNNVRSFLRVLGTIMHLFTDSDTVEELLSNYIMPFFEARPESEIRTAEAEGNAPASNVQRVVEGCYCLSKATGIFNELATYAVDAIVPLINNSSEEVRMQALRSLPDVLQAAASSGSEVNWDSVLEALAQATKRWKQYEGLLLFDTITSFLEIGGPITAEEHLSTIVAAAADAVKTREFVDANFTSALPVLTAALGSYPSLASDVCEIDGLLERTVGGLEQLRSENAAIEEMETENEEETRVELVACGSDDTAAACLDFLKAAVQALAESGAGGAEEIIGEVVDFVVFALSCPAEMTKANAWAFVGMLVKTAPAMISDILEHVLEAALSQSDENATDYVTGNIGFTMYNIATEEELDPIYAESLYENMRRAAVTNHESWARENIVCCLLRLLQVLGKTLKPSDEEDAKVIAAIQEMLPVITENEECPPECFDLCQQFSELYPLFK